MALHPKCIIRGIIGIGLCGIGVTLASCSVHVDTPLWAKSEARSSQPSRSAVRAPTTTASTSRRADAPDWERRTRGQYLQSSAEVVLPTIEVVEGDTLYGIASRHRTSVARLLELNGRETTKLAMGDRIILPPGTAPVPLRR